MNEKKSDMEVLCPEKQVEGYTLRPWNLKAVVELTPVLLDIRKRLEEKGITLDKLVKMKQKAMASIIFDFAEIVLPQIIKIISISLDIPEGDVSVFSLDKATIIMLNIVDLNIIYLKNFFGLVTERIQNLQLTSEMSEN